MAEPGKTSDKTYGNGVQDAQIANLSNDVANLHTDVKDLIKAVASLQTKAGVWGLLAGLIPAIGVLLTLVIRGVL